MHSQAVAAWDQRQAEVPGEPGLWVNFGSEMGRTYK